MQAEIDDITRQMSDVEQQLFAAQNVKKDVGSLMEKLARLQSNRKAKKASLVFQTMKKGPPYGDPFDDYHFAFIFLGNCFLLWLRRMRTVLVLLLLLMFAAALAHFLHQKYRASADNHARKQI